MILVVAVLGLALLVPLLGGRLTALATVQLRAGWTLVAALAAQTLVITVFPDRFPALHVPVHLASYVLIAAFFVVNARVPGVKIMAAGWLANFLVIAVNGGIMPASPEALRTAGRWTQTGEFANSAAVASPRLAWLGDVFAVPASWPLANVYSIGDVLLVVGAGVALLTLCGVGPHRRPPWRSPQVRRQEDSTSGPGTSGMVDRRGA